jgi:hypothetical protein
MLAKIVAALKNGSIKNVVPFGYPLPSSPYVVVKLEYNPIGRMIRVIAHMSQGDQLELEDYIFKESSDLLSGFESTDRYGNTFHIYDYGEWSEVVANNDDSTISMERIFYVPFHAH